MRGRSVASATTGRIRPSIHRTLGWRRLGRVLALLLVLVSAACSGQKTGTSGVPGPSEIRPPELANRPDGLARQFLDGVRNRDPERAYNLFSSRLQDRLSEQAFRQEIGRALETESTRAAYQSRWVQSERILGDRALVTVSDRKNPQLQPWTWEFRQEGSGWKIWDLDLPPVLSRFRD